MKKRTRRILAVLTVLVCVLSASVLLTVKSDAEYNPSYSDVSNAKYTITTEVWCGNVSGEWSVNTNATIYYANGTNSGSVKIGRVEDGHGHDITTFQSSSYPTKIVFTSDTIYSVNMCVNVSITGPSGKRTSCLSM